MTSEIKGVRGAQAGSAGLYAITGTPAAPASRDTGRQASVGDRVSLTGLGSQVRALAKTLEHVPVVDLARVSSVREAVVDGSYEIDNVRVADKIIRFELMLPEPRYGDASPA